MDVRSLGYRTDLMVRERSGSTVTDRGGHIVVRTASNPAFWWGNFVLVPGPPPPGGWHALRELFRREFPDADHVAIGVDGTGGDAGAPAELAALDLVARTSTVMSAPSLAAPPHRPPAGVVLRALAGERDWRAARELRVAVAHDEGVASATDEDFLDGQLAAARGLTERRDGWWFGAFEGTELRSTLGLIADGRGLARYQSVETHPGHRRRGLAGALVHAAAEHAIAHAGVHTLVIVAEIDGPAHGLYRSLGFADAEPAVEVAGRWMAA